MSCQTISLPQDLIHEMKTTGVWQESCPLPLSRLSLLKIHYFDFDGQEHTDGELVTMDAAADHLAEVFSTLHKQRFPISKIKSLHHYSGNDDHSMAENNTACFNYRLIYGANGPAPTSIHSYGLAIDINPLQNPYISFDEKESTASIHPKGSWQFINRGNQKPGMVEPIVPLLAKHGFFVWGGKWTTPIDYQHFQPPRGVSELLAILNADDAKRFFAFCIDNQAKLQSVPHGEHLDPLIQLYKRNPSEFFDNCLKYLN